MVNRKMSVLFGFLLTFLSVGTAAAKTQAECLDLYALGGFLTLTRQISESSMNILNIMQVLPNQSDELEFAHNTFEKLNVVTTAAQPIYSAAAFYQNIKPIRDRKIDTEFGVLMRQLQANLDRSLEYGGKLIQYTAGMKNIGLITEVRNASGLVQKMKSMAYGCPAE